MCGIAGYVGKKDGLKVVLDCLKALEYRGYDSAGVLFFDPLAKPILIKSSGKLDQLLIRLESVETAPGLAAIGHTRWATHGLPNEINAHPHADCQKKIFVVHNGIIENYQELKEKLVKTGHHFRSQTDTEVIAHLLEDFSRREKSFWKVLEKTLSKIIGAYALAIIQGEEPDRVYFARLGSPLILGLGRQEYWLASDSTPLADSSSRVVYLKDGQRGYISPTQFVVKPQRPKIENLNLNPEQTQKGNWPHFMLKEILEQPAVVANAVRGRLNRNFVKLGGLEQVQKKLSKIRKLEIIACGTSYHAGLWGELLFEEVARLPSKAIEASEYRYRQNILAPQTACLFISQSGETADTLAALRKAHAQKALTLGLVNRVGSAIARETSAGVYNHAGPEIGVASTKAFTSQLSILALMALYFRQQSLSWSDRSKIKDERQIRSALVAIPQKIKIILKQSDQIKSLAKKYQPYENFMFIGRKYNYPTALEGALKLKEISYVHAEGQAAGELKHGPIALISPQFPTIALVNQNSVYEKMLSNLQEIKTRRGPILAIATIGDKKIRQLADDVIYVPKTLEPLEPLLNIIPLQLFAYHFGVQRGHDVDKPRNLAKSVTVE